MCDREDPLPEQSAMTPRQLGDSIGTVNCEGLSELSGLLGAQADPAALSEEVAALKERLIERLIPLGHARSALEPDERQAVDMATSFAVSRVDMAAFQAMTDACTTYRQSHNALSNMLASFNVIHQYAAFELLAQQLPDEAARLGVG
jgi:hypothetical protein